MAAEGREARRAGTVEGYPVAQVPPEVGNGTEAHAGRGCGSGRRMKIYREPPSYQQADAETTLRVVLGAGELREAQ